jgi:MerR family transcriptional regulator, light-induced transcriptional regulator
MPTEAASTDPAVRRVVRRMLHEVARGDATAVHAIIEQLLAEGSSRGAVVATYLAGVQREIGRRWQDGRWSVAQEHTATAIVEDELTMLAATLPAPSLDVEVMVVCAEGEWHTLPARMAGLLLRERGFRIRLVGGSVPADDLDRTLSESPPDYLAVSCTYPLALAGAARIAAVARERGIPTLAGGAGFGRGPHRARRLGLDGWAASIPEGAQLLLRWGDTPPSVAEAAGPAIDLDALHDRWRVMADEVLDRLRAVDAVHVPADRPVTPLRRDLIELLQAAHLTALCEDPTLFTDHIDQLGSSPQHRGLPPAAIPRTIEILRELVGVYEPADVEARERLDEVLRTSAPSMGDEVPVLGQSAMIARTLIEVEDPSLLQQRLVTLAEELVGTCDRVGFLAFDRGEHATPAPTSWPSLRVEEIERELGEGPYLDAIERREVIQSRDLSTDERWPDFGPAVVEHTSIRSVLAIPLIIRQQLIGVLGLFADAIDAFDDHDRSVAVSFATHAAVALHAAIQQRTLTEAISTRDVIGQAKGILMEREGIADDRAFELLRTVSSRTNTKLRDVAAYIVRTRA